MSRKKIRLEQLRVTVLVSAARQPLNQRMVAHAPDRQALAMAQDWLPHAGELKVVGIGPMPTACQQAYWAQGIDQVVQLAVADPVDPTQWLAAASEYTAACDLLVLSERLDGSVNSAWLDGLLPYLLGAQQQRLVVDKVVAVAVQKEGVLVTQNLGQGARRQLLLTEAAVLVMAPNLTVNVGHAAYRSERAAQAYRQPDSASLAAEERVTAQDGVEPFTLRLRPLQPKAELSGPQRLLAAIGSASGDNGFVIKTGTAIEKAQLIMAYLQKQGVINHLQGESNHERKQY